MISTAMALASALFCNAALGRKLTPRQLRLVRCALKPEYSPPPFDRVRASEAGALGSPLAAGVLDGLEQGLLAGGAALAGVAGELGVAESGTARGEALAELGHVEHALVEDGGRFSR